MHSIITDFSKSFEKLTIWQRDGSRIEITAIGKKGVLYWTRTSSGEILVGIDRDGLDKILRIIGAQDQEEAAVLHCALRDLSKAGYDNLDVELNLTGEGDRFKIAYRDIHANSSVYEAFNDTSAFLATRRGYSQPS